MMNYISENVAVAGQSGVIERRNFYQVFISLSLLFIPVLALYFYCKRKCNFTAGCCQA
jgi:NADH:ubiquinone oxidoreductase subunit K